MSSTWYLAVCDNHKVYTAVMVNDPIRSQWLLGDRASSIKQWLIRHFGCELRLVWRDDQQDPLWKTHTKEDFDPDVICALCGCVVDGKAAALDDKCEAVSLCHTEDRDCYHRWTTYGERDGRKSDDPAVHRSATSSMRRAP